MKKVAVVVLALAFLMVFAAVSPAFALTMTPPPYTMTTGRFVGGDYVVYMPTSTHQVTEYIVDNYGVTDKTFVIGVSMGGTIALNLAHKYPNLYSGVLDIVGAKDPFENYAYGQTWITKTVAELRAIFSIPASVPDYLIAGLKVFFATVWANMIEANGGTPEEKPKAYERRDPVFNADIEIPTISLVGAIDMLVPLFSHLHYQAAIADAGRSDLYRLYIISNGGHADAPVMDQVPTKLLELIAWSDSLD